MTLNWLRLLPTSSGSAVLINGRNLGYCRSIYLSNGEEQELSWPLFLDDIAVMVGTHNPELTID